MAENTFAEGFSTDRVTIGRSAVRSINAASVDMTQSAVQRLTGETINASNSAAGIVNGTTVEFKDSGVGFAAGDYVRIEESKVFVLLAPRVSGNITATITLPAAFAFGAGFFVARRLFQSVFSRRER